MLPGALLVCCSKRLVSGCLEVQHIRETQGARAVGGCQQWPQKVGALWDRTGWEGGGVLTTAKCSGSQRLVDSLWEHVTTRKAEVFHQAGEPERPDAQQLLRVHLLSLEEDDVLTGNRRNIIRGFWS